MYWRRHLLAATGTGARGAGLRLVVWPESAVVHGDTAFSNTAHGNVAHADFDNKGHSDTPFQNVAFSNIAAVSTNAAEAGRGRI